ncbi:DsbA family protein [Streptomyces sp. NPDC058045]|uniref:DsbA family protein n=1 Tax=Streptomyces sp. NPDC058045 TaxID=3346311 RepID=UPI0036F02CAF
MSEKNPEPDENGPQQPKPEEATADEARPAEATADAPTPAEAPGETPEPDEVPSGGGQFAKAGRAAAPAPSRRRRGSRIVAAVVLAAAVVTAGVTLATGGDGDPSPTPSGSGEAAQAEEAQGETAGNAGLLALARREDGDPLAVGRADAPVVMIEYADFQCPYCGRFIRETEPKLIKDYVDKGTLRIEWRNFPIFGAESQRAAQAAWAAGRQGRFWEFQREAYRKDRKRNQGEFSAEKLAGMAERAGVNDLGRFRRDLSSGAARKAVRKDTGEGYSLGVSSTPAFLVNTTPLLGAQPTRAFTEAIEKAAAQERGSKEGGGGGRD